MSNRTTEQVSVMKHYLVTALHRDEPSDTPRMLHYVSAPDPQEAKRVAEDYWHQIGYRPISTLVTRRVVTK